MATYFCPNCWHELNQREQKCPECGYNLSIDTQYSYEEKLLRALKHPIRENRMMAIHILGQLRSERAVTEFREILANEVDYYVLREVLQALAAIDTPQSRMLVAAATNHHSKLVQQIARQLSGT